jgi:hypothetical protein
MMQKKMNFEASPESPVRRPGIPKPTVQELDRKRRVSRGDELRYKKRSKSTPIGDRPLAGKTREELTHFLNWSTSYESVGRDTDFANCVRDLLVPELAEAYLKSNYPRLHRDDYRDDRFKRLFRKFKKKIEKIEEKDWTTSTVATELCDAYHTTFGAADDFEYVDDKQARRVTRLVGGTSMYSSLDDKNKELVDQVYPEIDDDDDDDDDDQDEDEKKVPEPVSAFVERYLEETTEATVRVRDVLGARDGEGEVNYTKSFGEFLKDPFTFPA